jgi:hypothetical protein
MQVVAGVHRTGTGLSGARQPPIPLEQFAKVMGNLITFRTPSMMRFRRAKGT